MHQFESSVTCFLQRCFSPTQSVGSCQYNNLSWMLETMDHSRI
jgi:hypothetical protein